MIYLIIDSGGGAELGAIEVADAADDEAIITELCAAGYLEGNADSYEITDGDAFAEEGERTVRDENGPVLVLAPVEPDDDDEENGEDYDAEEPANDEAA
jgi:hypothetical protein